MKKLFAAGGIAALMAAVGRRLRGARAVRRPVSRDQEWGDYRAMRGSW